jgi:signal transduction histidine kinase
VIDTGIGVPEAFRDGLFEQFARADATMTRRYGGPGPGLFISQRLASLLGGRVEYAPGETGSVFRLVLAICRATSFATRWVLQR